MDVSVDGGGTSSVPGRVEVNELGQPLGLLVPGWTPRPLPTAPVMSGRYVRLERLDPDRHGNELFAADSTGTRGESWTYLPYGPFDDLGSYRGWLSEMAGHGDPFFYAIIDTDPLSTARGRAVGVASYLRVQPDHGSIEVGHLHYSPRLQQRRGATEAQYLFMRYVFADLRYRRYECKCDALNAASRSAAARLGFSYEGTFRHDRVVKGRNRDTAWYSITDDEWPLTAAALRSWLNPANFDDHGRQQTRLRVPNRAR